MMELALPAGSMQAALQAFKEGADAVYLGMKQFSARKSAMNFSFDELASLRRIADDQGKKIYVTVNTIVEDSELAQVLSTIRQVAFIGTEGLIVQDLGIARIIGNRFPSIPLHGSTQLAVHTAEGVREMRDAGFSRVVLSRELTLEEIRAIRKACPDIELKVFIHGALCYGFSGICMASELLCDRSANRGACAQICRTWFTLEPTPLSKTSPRPADRKLRDGWFFSMSDLDAGAIVRELDRMGIDSAKVEGRMKSPSYVAAATRYYRALLDGVADQEEIDRLRDELSTTFGRKATGGWLGSYGRDGQEAPGKPAPRGTGSLGSIVYPGHMGVPAAETTAVLRTGGRTYLQVRTIRPLAVRDGLMFLIPGQTAPTEAVKFSVSSIFDRTGRSLTDVPAGRQIAIPLPSDAARSIEAIGKGDMLYAISSHDQTMALIHDENLPRRKRTVPLSITLTNASMILRSIWNCDYLPMTRIERTYPISVSVARKPQPLRDNLRTIFSASDTSLFATDDISVENRTGEEEQMIFLPLSHLKEIRRNWYASLDETLRRWFEEPLASPSRTIERTLASFPSVMKRTETILPPRTAILPPTQDPLPWLDIERVARSLSHKTVKTAKDVVGLLPQHEETFYIPLSPVMFDEPTYFESLDMLVDELSCRRLSTDTLFGLNNIAQIRWARRHPQVRCFCDVYIYLANSQAACRLLELLPSLEGGYYWMERHALPDLAGWPFVPVVVEATFVPPLFISRSCFRHDSLGLSCEDCPRSGTWKVSQHGISYTVRVDHCITTVQKKS